MRSLLSLSVAAVVAAGAPANARAQSGKKVVFVNSYHQGYEWSDGIEEGAAKVLRASGVEVELVRMDTKRNGDEKSKKQAGLDAKAAIERAKPDAVIVADDNAVKYLLQPFFKDGAIPFVFCGVNWDAGAYGLPYRNATGMVEVALAKQLVERLADYAKGKRIGYLTADTETERADQRAYRDRLGIRFASERFVNTFAEWKAAYREMQGEVDMLVLGSFASVTGWSDGEAKAWAEAHARIPVGAPYDFDMPFAMLGLTKVAAEQGIFAAKAALRILKGEPPSKIPVATNKEGQIMLNVKLAARAGVVFKPDLVRNAVVLR
jgi:ABC-type uncharacterized transport system substrate-binding protein